MIDIIHITTTIICTFLIVTITWFCVDWRMNKVNPITHIVIRYKARKSVNKILKKDWYIKKIAKYYIEKASKKGEYRVFVRLKKHNSVLWACSNIIINKKGKIIKEDFDMDFYDKNEQLVSDIIKRLENVKRIKRKYVWLGNTHI